MASKESSERSGWKRSHTCGELRPENQGEIITLCGWVANRRDHGRIFFLDLRDRHGITQITVDPEIEGTSDELLELAGNLSAEDVLSVTGKVKLRAADQINPNRATGAIEVLPLRMEILAEAETPPFEILDRVEASTELRLQHRYLDLRRRPLLEALELRSKVVHAIRSHLFGEDFIEVETPILTRATPEGARDYLVPSRIHKGRFYALPQSPQIFKQILMVGGIDRYYQIARCFRDEDQRTDRQPEFTQLDLELSFVEEDEVLAAMEGTIGHAFREVLGFELDLPFPRLSFPEAMSRFGLDKPDLRFGMELLDLSEPAGGCGFRVFEDVLEGGGKVKALRVEGGGSFSRKVIDGYAEHVTEFGARGLLWLKAGEEGLSGPVAKFFPEGRGRALCGATGAGPGDLILFCADREEVVHRALGELRNKLAQDLGLLDPGVFRFLWVTDFPLFQWSRERETWEPSHHPFTAPRDWEADFGEDPGSHLSRAYDLVLNGWELGSGSIRIHRREVQERLFAFLGIGREEAETRFGHLLAALRYGAPPHGGFALGLDRFVALMNRQTGIRDVIAFPKTTSASCPLTGAPSKVPGDQLEELAIRTVEEP